MEILIIYVAISVWMFIKNNYKDTIIKIIVRLGEKKFGKEFSDSYLALSKETGSIIENSALLLAGRVRGGLTWPSAVLVLGGREGYEWKHEVNQASGR